MSLVVGGDWLENFRKLALNMPAPDLHTYKDQINILLCGPTGYAKNSTGNSILGSRQFVASSNGDIRTTTIELKSTTYENYKVKIADCPPAPRQKASNEMVLKFSDTVMPQLLKLCPKGFHAALIVLQFGSRSYEEEDFAMAMLKEMFGQQFIEEHCICVISDGDMFRNVSTSGYQRSTQNLNDWCRKQDEASVLGRIFRACKYRCVRFDNFTNDVDIKKEQVRQLMSMIIDSWSKTYSPPVVSVNPNLRVKADIHILNETASTPDEFQNQLKFIEEYTSSYNLSPDTAQVSVMIFGEDDHVRFDFSELSNHDELAETLLRAPFLKPSSGTDKALMLARQESLSPSGGTRRGVKQVVVLLTEGHSADETRTIEEADQIKSSGAEIIVVGVASVNRGILTAIASEPTNVYIADNYQELQDLPTEVAKKTAEKAPEFKSTADILFIMDSSGSISPEDYQKGLDFVIYMANNFNMGPSEVLYSLMVFSSIPQILFDFTLTNHDQVKKGIQAAPHMRQLTDTAAALNLARTQAFTARNGCRGRKKLAIIITDGCSNDLLETTRAAEKLSDSGVLTLAVGVGIVNRTELEYIATMPEDVYMVDNYSELKEKVETAISQKADELETAIRNRTRPPLPTPATAVFGVVSSLNTLKS